MNGILLLGGGGHCVSVLDVLLETAQFDAIGIVDSNQSVTSLMGIPVLGGDEKLRILFSDTYRNAIVTVGSVGHTAVRRRLYRLAVSLGFSFPVISARSSLISRHSHLEPGVFIGKAAVINAGTVVGRCVILNTSAVIEHHCEIGEFAHISPGAVLLGHSRVGTDSHIGAGAMVKQGVSIGNNTIIGMGSVVVSDIPDGVVAMGNPCRIVRDNK